MHLSDAIDRYISFFGCFFTTVTCHCSLIFTDDYLVTFFLPATVLRLPLRVLELVRVLCPRTGKPLRCLKPLYEPISIKRLMFSCFSERSSPSTVILSVMYLRILVRSSSFQ